MNTIKINQLPQLVFAHIFNAENYDNKLLPSPERVEISFITKGSLTCSQNGTTFEAKQNDIICNTFLSPLNIHSDKFHEHHTVCYSFPVDHSDSSDDAYICLPVLTHPREDSNRILTVIDNIIRLSTVHSSQRLTCLGQFLHLLDLIHECNKKTYSSIRSSDFQYVKRAKKYIYDHLHVPIEQKEVAKYLGITPEYLCSIFKNTEGISMMTFINRIKLEKISTIIKKENTKLYKAAEMFGYNDPNYVSRLYKKYFHKNITSP